MSSVWTSWSLLSGVGLASLSSLKLLKVSYDSSSFWFTCKLLFVVYYGDIYLTSSLYSASDYYAILDGKSNRKTYIYAELSKQFSKFIFFIFMSLNSSKSRLMRPTTSTFGPFFSMISIFIFIVANLLFGTSFFLSLSARSAKLRSFAANLVWLRPVERQELCLLNRIFCT